MPVSLTRLAFAGALALPLAAFAAAPLSVSESVTVAVPPQAVWKLIGDFKGLPGWHPVVATTTITSGKDNTPGAVREIATKDGAKLVEQLLAYSSGSHSMTYKIVDSPLPVTDYRSTLTVLPAGKGSKIVWKSSFKRNPAADGVDDAKARDIVAGIYRAGFDGIKEKLAQ